MFGKSHAISTSTQFPCQRSLKMADKTATRTRIWHSRLDSFIMYAKKDVRRLLTDRWTCLQVKPLATVKNCKGDRTNAIVSCFCVYWESWHLNEKLKSYRAFNQSENKSYCLIFFTLALRALDLYAFAVVYNQKPVPTKIMRFTDFGRLRVLIGLQRYPKSYKVSVLQLKYNQEELFLCF